MKATLFLENSRKSEMRRESKAEGSQWTGNHVCASQLLLCFGSFCTLTL